MCHFTLGTSENMGYVQFWRCNVSSFLVSSLADLDLPCSGPFLTMLNLVLYVFVRDIQPDSLRTGKYSYLGTSLSPRILVGCFH